MYSPKELEAEVDHSFFDSDSENKSSAARDDGDTIHKAQPPWSGAEHGGKKSFQFKGQSRAFSVASSACGDMSQTGSSQNEEAPKNNIHASGESGSSADDEGEDEDGYKQSEEEDEDEEEESEEEQKEKPTGRSVVGLSVPKRPSGRLGRRRLSSSSGSESSYSESGSYISESVFPARRKSSEGPSLESSLFTNPQFTHNVASNNEKLWPPPGESDDTVTDVTPLSTPDISPIQSFDLTSGPGDKEGFADSASRKHNTSMDLRVLDCSDPEGERTSSTGSREALADTNGSQSKASGSIVAGMDSRRDQKAADDAMDLNQLLKAFLSVEQKAEKSSQLDLPVGQSRKNYSFSNDEVRRIDRENQRLLRALSRQAPRPSSTSGRGAPVRLYHSTLNRQREQQRIERENMAFLKRLESVKPTVGMRRSEQLASYQRHVRYPGGTGIVSVPNRSSPSRSSAGPISNEGDVFGQQLLSMSFTGPCSGSRLSRSRPEFSVSLTAPKPSRGPEPRAAWS